VPWDLADCRDLLDAVRLVVANIRRGEVTFGPGFHYVTTCPARGFRAVCPDGNDYRKELDQ
jgi:hypothetical protein